MPRAGEHISEWLLEPAPEIHIETKPISSSFGHYRWSFHRDMSIRFTDGQKIRHKGRNCITWIGTYIASLNRILHDGLYYKSPSGFAEAHYHNSPHSTRRTANGWKECEYEIDGTWISIDDWWWML
jgi:hypothetical protein